MHDRDEYRPKRLLDRFAQRSHRPGTTIIVVLSGVTGLSLVSLLTNNNIDTLV